MILVDDAESESQDADDVNADVAKKADSKKEEVVESAAA